MSTGEVIHTSSTGGQKAGNDVRMSLLPVRELMEVAELFGKGARKYDAHNWTRGYEWSLSYDALHRHLAEFWAGNELDDGEGGTGLQHLSCAAFHVLALMYFAKHHRALDDRHIPPAQPVGTVESGLISIDHDPTIIFTDPEPPYHVNFEDWLDKSKWDFVYERDTLPSGAEGMWLSESTKLVYWFVDGQWWVMRADAKTEDPWMLSTYQGKDVPASAGPFVSYVALQQD